MTPVAQILNLQCRHSVGVQTQRPTTPEAITPATQICAPIKEGTPNCRRNPANSSCVPSHTMLEIRPSLLEIRKEHRLLRITLNRPEKRNALSLSMCRDLVAAIEAADADPSIGAILLSGNGKAFCAGMDLAEALEVDRDLLDDVHEQIFTIGYRVRTPIIAGVHGPALAGGTGLAANAHILVANENASFGLTEIRIGLWPILIFRMVSAAVGERRATELAMTGRTFTGAEALSYGLVHELSPFPVARAAEIALQISQSSADAIHSGLDYRIQTRDLNWEQTGALGREIRKNAMSAGDFAEGVRAFLEKTKPNWPSLKKGDRP